MIKLVWRDGSNYKTVKGELLNQDKYFIIIKTLNGNELSVAKTEVVCMKRYVGDMYGAEQY